MKADVSGPGDDRCEETLEKHSNRVQCDRAFSGGSRTHWKVGVQLRQFSLTPRSPSEKERGRPEDPKAPSRPPPASWQRPCSRSQRTPEKCKKGSINMQEMKGGFCFAFSLRFSSLQRHVFSPGIHSVTISVLLKACELLCAYKQN